MSNMKKKRKHILLKNEITMLQDIVANEVFPILECRVSLIRRLQELKEEWYYSPSKPKGKNDNYIIKNDNIITK